MAGAHGARSVGAMNQLTLRTSQAGLALMGAVVCFGSIYFSAIAPPVGLHFAFGIVKVLGYDEPEAGLFMAFDVALIGLLARAGR